MSHFSYKIRNDEIPPFLPSRRVRGLPSPFFLPSVGLNKHPLMIEEDGSPPSSLAYIGCPLKDRTPSSTLLVKMTAEGRSFLSSFCLLPGERSPLPPFHQDVFPLRGSLRWITVKRNAFLLSAISGVGLNFPPLLLLSPLSRRPTLVVQFPVDTGEGFPPLFFCNEDITPLPRKVGCLSLRVTGKRDFLSPPFLVENSSSLLFFFECSRGGALLSFQNFERISTPSSLRRVGEASLPPQEKGDHTLFCFSLR